MCVNMWGAKRSEEEEEGGVCVCVCKDIAMSEIKFAWYPYTGNR